MARDSLLTQALNALSNGEFTNPTPAISVPQAAPVQPVSTKDLQVADATQRITSDFAVNKFNQLWLKTSRNSFQPLT